MRATLFGARGHKHWHGATSTTTLTHIAIQEALDGKLGSADCPACFLIKSARDFLGTEIERNNPRIGILGSRLMGGKLEAIFWSITRNEHS